MFKEKKNIFNKKFADTHNLFRGDDDDGVTIVAENRFIMTIFWPAVNGHCSTFNFRTELMDRPSPR